MICLRPASSRDASRVLGRPLSCAQTRSSTAPSWISLLLAVIALSDFLLEQRHLAFEADDAIQLRDEIERGLAAQAGDVAPHREVTIDAVGAQDKEQGGKVTQSETPLFLKTDQHDLERAPIFLQLFGGREEDLDERHGTSTLRALKAHAHGMPVRDRGARRVHCRHPSAYSAAGPTAKVSTGAFTTAVRLP